MPSNPRVPALIRLARVGRERRSRLRHRVDVVQLSGSCSYLHGSRHREERRMQLVWVLVSMESAILIPSCLIMVIILTIC